MYILTAESFREQLIGRHEPNHVRVTMTNENTTLGYMAIPVEQTIDAFKLASAINRYAGDPKPSNMHYLSKRLRCANADDRRALLQLLDKFRTVTEGENDE